MKLTYKQYDLHLKHTFTISRSSSDVRHVVIIRIEHDGITGFGEAAPSPRYNESPQSVIDFLHTVKLPSSFNPGQINEILDAVNASGHGNTSAKAAIDIALHDWLGKKLHLPLWKMWNLDKDKTPLTSFTIGIDSPEIIGQKIKEAEEFPILKVKVGILNDEEIIKTIRKLTDKVLRVDANEGWKSKELALEKILWMEEQNIELIEQPMPVAQIDDIAWLRERVHIPIIADESVKNLSDLPMLNGVFDGINIKLMKCRGLREALKMIRAARSLNMKIMLGCMIETSLGISAAANLSPLVDYADLDGNLLITNDPFSGIDVNSGRIVLSENRGLGVEIKN
jgi:L-Ala-D/L-Glu epimerase